MEDVSLQTYEIGSTVRTPDGAGMVVKMNRGTGVVVVHTDTSQNPWSIEELEGFAASCLDYEGLEEWLESPPPEQSTTGLTTESVNCACPCGTSGACYHNRRGGKSLMHMRNGGCRCEEANCVCLT